MRRTMSGAQLIQLKQDLMVLGDGWDKCLGGIPKTGIVAMWGGSGNGKSAAAMSLCSEICKFCKVLYVAAEEGYGPSLQNTARRYDMAAAKTRFQVSIDTYDELVERLDKRESAHVVVIDSPQAMGLKKSQFQELRQKYGNRKLIIFVCQADGKQPKGKVAQDIKFMADIKIWVSGFKAFSHGRFYGETGEKVIWDEGARRAYGRDNKEVNNGDTTEDTGTDQRLAEVPAMVG